MAAGVEFIVGGGAAAVLHGAPIVDGPSAIRLLDLETLIGVKAAAERARDKLVLPILLALRDRADRGR